ncbi:MAG: 4Fe-4S binding protein [Candidatus Thermoplasmatota archaeon]|nr:4Fe-4S binding protein [Candidatus Thermoplasmatota archaeon]
MSDFENTGILSISDLVLPTNEQLEKGVAITECIQRIPCNPCVDSCPVHAISMKDINALPVVDYDACIACGRCVGVCPGLAIFVVKVQGDQALITLPYEFLPRPQKGESVSVLDRAGKTMGKGKIIRVKQQGRTSIITVSVEKKYAMDVRNIRV